MQANGHLHLNLNSQLFVGGSAFKQQGFLGCIRALQVNGVHLNLDERAKLTPGVSAGCPGHCSNSASLCHNRGRCIEQSSGYVCDCTHSAYTGPSCRDEVSVSFKRGSSVNYAFRDSFLVMRDGHSQTTLSISTESREDVAFSFVTTQTPAMLLTISTFSQQYVAIILARNGSLQIWYQLHEEKEPDVFTPTFCSLADGQHHRVQIHREAKDVYVQVDHKSNKYTLSSDTKLNSVRSLTLGKVTGTDALDEKVALAGSRGFVGCFSSVQYNHVAPLKAALQNRGSSLVTIQGSLVESSCRVHSASTSNSFSDHVEEPDRANEQGGGVIQHDSAVIGGVVTAVVFSSLCMLAVMTRFLYQHWQAQRMASLQEKETQRRLEPGFHAELHTHNSTHHMQDSLREYYI